ncbi:hypothetical protein BC629DRAFT_1440077 [Irpex lacteus]|nr:hypothetical protein BC629DRAFT_1440077 [Irpex lacteus]
MSGVDKGRIAAESGVSLPRGRDASTRRLKQEQSWRSLQQPTDGSTLLSSLWPSGLPQYIRGDTSIQSVQANNKLVPTHIDTLRDWCYVVRDKDQRNTPRECFLAYVRPEPETGRIEEVTVRFQGVVKDAEIGVYGTWRGSKETVMSATQRLTLFGGTMRTVHNQQVIAATTLRRYVYQEMGVEQEEHGRPPSQIQFVRSVFEKVPPGTKQYPAPPNDPENNLAAKAATVNRQWRVIGGLQIGVQSQNEVRAAVPREIRRGDFVDVTAILSISRSQRTHQTYVNFYPLKVVRLATANTVLKLAPRVTSPIQENEPDVMDEDADKPLESGPLTKRATCSVSDL